MKPVVRRTITGTSLAAGAALLFVLADRFPDARVPWAVATVLGLLSAWELTRMGRLGSLSLAGPLYTAALGVATAAFLLPPFLDHPVAPLVPLAVLGPGVALLVRALGRANASPVDFPGSAAAWTLGLALWSVVPLHGLSAVDAVWGIRGLVGLVIVAKIGDVFGYFVGRAVGRRHPFPRLSPGKTVAGCVASLVSGALAGAVLVPAGVFPDARLGWIGGALFGAITNVAAQAGDLLESHVKRTAGVKDASHLAGPAGGVLDVVDSLLVVLPVALLVGPALLSGGP